MTKELLLLTGYYLNRHLLRIGILEYPTYRVHCEDEEDSQCVLGESPGWGRTRFRYFGAQFLELEVVKGLHQHGVEVYQIHKADGIT